jgi:hypothetical protein
MQSVKVIKANKVSDFDAELAITEAEVAERVLKYHLRKCDDLGTAQRMADILSALAVSYKVKVLALSK